MIHNQCGGKATSKQVLTTPFGKFMNDYKKYTRIKIICIQQNKQKDSIDIFMI